MRIRRASGRLVIAAGILVASLLATTSAANAAAIVTRGSHGPTIVTTSFVGDSLWMEKVNTSHFHAGHVCGFKSDVWGTLRDGGSYYKQSAYEPACIPGIGSRAISIYKAFRNGSQLCTQFYEDGDWINGIPCAGISA
jgi:hypothetical protein